MTLDSVFLQPCLILDSHSDSLFGLGSEWGDGETVSLDSRALAGSHSRVQGKLGQSDGRQAGGAQALSLRTTETQQAGVFSACWKMIRWPAALLCAGYGLAHSTGPGPSWLTEPDLKLHAGS